MAKGLFTQGMCVLLRQPVSLSDLEARLKDFQLIGKTETVEEGTTQETLVMNYRDEVGGHLLVTASATPWPDDMGDPQSAPDRFVAWSLGQYGPLAFPGCLQRASEQAWGWDQAETAVAEHKAYVRMLISYVLGSEESEDDDDDEIPLIPDDYDALDELRFLTKAVEALLEMPEAICYFNPGGEVLRDDNGLRQGLNSAWSHDIPPLDMWTNVRLFRAADDWTLMDTVGNGQFDLPDMEAVYIAGRYEPAEVEDFLRNASLYLLNEDEEVEDGDSADGPGEVTWVAMECNDSLTDPPRPTIRWIPQDSSEPPEALLDAGEPDEDFDEDEQADDGDAYFDNDAAVGFGENAGDEFSTSLFGSDALNSDLFDDELDEDIDADFPSDDDSDSEDPEKS